MMWWFLREKSESKAGLHISCWILMSKFRIPGHEKGSPWSSNERSFGFRGDFDWIFIQWLKITCIMQRISQGIINMIAGDGRLANRVTTHFSTLGNLRPSWSKQYTCFKWSYNWATEHFVTKLYRSNLTFSSHGLTAYGIAQQILQV